MDDVSALKRKLYQSQQSRIRAWKALQGIRQVLVSIADDPLPPTNEPACFEAEGEALRKALLNFLWRLNLDLDNISKAVEAMRPYMGNTVGSSSYPHVLLCLNRALVKLTDRSSNLMMTTKKLG